MFKNCRGDQRGSNGVTAPRTSGGRFCKRSSVPAFVSECGYALVVFDSSKEKSTKQVESEVVNTGNDGNLQQDTNSHTDQDTGAFDEVHYALKCPRHHAPATTMDNHSNGTMVLHSSIDTSFPSAVRNLDSISAVDAATSVDKFAYANVTCAFYDLTSSSVLSAFNGRDGGPPVNTDDMFRAHLVYQCALDRRSLGNSLLYVTGLDPWVTLHGLNISTNGFSVKPVTSEVNRKKALELFVKKRLLCGTREENRHDMNIFTAHPFHMIEASNAKGKLCTVSVFRVATLNNGHRLIVLEMIASVSARENITGGGTAMMQVLRKLSMISPYHAGHITAATLRTKKAVRFYERQLPSVNCPQSRAFMVSHAFLDPNVELKRDLDTRCTTVWPDA